MPDRPIQREELDTQDFCRSIDWYAEGQGRVVEVNGIRLTVRLVDRKGRRARIVITAPPNAVFSDLGGEKE